MTRSVLLFRQELWKSVLLHVFQLFRPSTNTAAGRACASVWQLLQPAPPVRPWSGFRWQSHHCGCWVRRDAPNTQSTLSPHSVFTLCQHSVFTLSQHPVFTLSPHPVFTLSPHPVFTLSQHSVFTLSQHWVFTLSQHSVFTFSQHSVFTLGSFPSGCHIGHAREWKWNWSRFHCIQFALEHTRCGQCSMFFISRWREASILFTKFYPGLCTLLGSTEVWKIFIGDIISDYENGLQLFWFITVETLSSKKSFYFCVFYF